MPDLSAERVDYHSAHLREAAAPADPLVLVERWLAEAVQAKERGDLVEPNAMVVATSVADRPSARTVLLKAVTEGCFVFFSNYTSAKGRQLDANPRVALHLGWYAQFRQLRVEGVSRRTPREESAAYFATRPRGSQLGAWASAQSSEVASVAELDASYHEAEQRFAGRDVPCPPHWGGFSVRPDMIEFWQGQPSRMHDRLRYDRGERGWRLSRLAP